MRRFRSIYVSFVFGAFMGCDFEPGGEIFTAVDPASLDGITIDLENYPEQQILLKSKTEFRYSVQTKYTKLSESRVLLNNEIIWITSSPGGAFQLDPANMKTGSYKLRIEYAATSETGSLAEKVGAEVIYVWTERTIVVSHDIPQNASDPNAIAITAVENLDNSIKVSWTPYNNFNFEKYEVIRQDFDQEGNPQGGGIIPAMSPDPTYTHVFDRQYLGGKSQYSIKLYAAGKTYTSPPVSYEHPYKPNVSYQIQAGGNVTITWNNISALSNNFKAYKLEVVDVIGGYYQTVTFDKSSVMDTTVTFVPENFRFGKTKTLRLRIYPSTDSYYSKVHVSKMSYGDWFPFFDGYNLPLYFNVNTRKFYYRAWKSGILNVADENGKPLDSLDRYYTFLQINNSIGIATSNYKNYRINLETMDNEGLIAVPDGNVFGVSDDNKVAIFTTNDGGKVFTLQGAELLALGFPTGEGYKGISPNGQYVFAQPNLYRFNGTSFEKWASWYTFNIKSVSFLPREPTKIIIGEKSRIWRYNIEANTNELTSTQYTGPCNFDPVTEKLGCLNGDQFVILNSEDFQLYKTLPVQADAGLFYLLNGKVICSSGAQIELSDIP